MQASAVGPNPVTQVGQRLVSQEPMYIILNLGISESFQRINWAQLGFPAQMLVDYVRVYQREDEPNLGCDPPEMPTSQYINDHLPAYLVGRFLRSEVLPWRPSIFGFLDICLALSDSYNPADSYLSRQNPNFTTWDAAGLKKPRNSMQGC